MLEVPIAFLDPQIIMLQCYQGMKTLSQTQFYPVKTPTHSYFEMNLLILKGIIMKRIWKGSTKYQVSPLH